MEDDHGPLLERQPPELARELIALGHHRREICPGAWSIVGRHVQLDEIPSTHLLRVPVARSDGEPVKPGVPRVGVPKRSNVAPRQLECLLDRVLSAIRVPQDEAGDGMHAGKRRSHQDGERVVVARLRSFDELSLHVATTATRLTWPRSLRYEAIQGPNGSAALWNTGAQDMDSSAMMRPMDARSEVGIRDRLRVGVVRAVSIADKSGDDDDVRLRKRVGVAAGYITVVAPLTLPLESPAGGLGLLLGVGLSAYSAINLLILARTGRFERFVIALIASGPFFVFCTNVLAGGILSNSAGFVWAFLVPAYALLALGPRRATPWFFAFLGSMLLAVALDPLIRNRFEPPPYIVQLVFYAQNIGVPLAITFLLLRYTDLRRRAAEARSDELLTNAIPASIATRLRRGESRIAEAYPDTTVVFADISGFTSWANATPPDRVVALLDDLFTRLDAVAAASGVEKIKTVGDAYMAVAGAPEANPEHAVAAVRFSRSVLAEVDAWRRANDLQLGVRIGLASGPVVGGIIGRRRILFDLWGTTVNAAARMESSGVPGRIHIAESTRALLRDSEPVEERTVEVKGFGSLKTYLLADARGLTASS